MGAPVTASHRTLRIPPVLLPGDPDAPQARVAEESRQVILDGMNGTGSQEAVTLLLQMLADAQRSPPIEEDPEPQQTVRAQIPSLSVLDLVTPSLLKRAVLTLAVALAFLQPLATQAAASLFSSRSSVESKLDDIVVSLAEYKADQDRDRGNLAQLAAWMVASEQARQAGKPPPEVPSMVKLMAATDAVQRTTGK